MTANKIPASSGIHADGIAQLHQACARSGAPRRLVLAIKDARVTLSTSWAGMPSGWSAPNNR